jgi:outer membrane beta-barrel protein
MMTRLLLLLALSLMLPLKASAAANSSSSDDEYSFQWLDPDKKIYVLQNRKFLKANHAMLSVLGGVGLSSPYRDSFSFEGRLSYHFTEMFGLEFFYSTLFNRENGTYEALKASAGVGVLPIVREITSQMGVLFQYVPWYAKINVFNTILHFDWYFSAGAGTLGTQLDQRSSISAAPNYTKENLFSAFIGTGHQFHLSRELDFRLDFSGAFYRAPLLGTTGASSWFSNYTFGIGLGYRI